MVATGFTSGDTRKVDVAGDTMTGDLVLSDSSPDTALSAASRGYVDAAVGGVGAIPLTQKGAPGGVAELDGAGLLPHARLPALTGTDITSGTVAYARLPVGNAASTVAAGDDPRIISGPASTVDLAAAVALLVPTADVGAPGGVASLDGAGLVPYAQIPPLAAGSITAGKNLFDASAAAGPDKFWNGAGTVPIDLVGYYASAKMVAVPGAVYSVNNCRAYGFMSSAGTFIAGQYVAVTGSVPVTFTAPPTAAYLVVSVLIANLPTCQVEIAPAPTVFEPFGQVVPRLLVNGGFADNAVADIPSVARLADITVFRAGTEMLVRSRFDATRDILMPVSLQIGPENQVCFYSAANPNVMLVDSTTQDPLIWPSITLGTAIHGAADDNCPISTQWTYIGANHGYIAGSRLTLAGHDKTTADVGSQWTDGTRTYTLLAVESTADMLFGNQYTVSAGVVTGSTTVPAAPLTHVSGATHTATITPTATVLTQVFPSSHSHTYTVAVDGREPRDGKTYGQLLTITETYTIASYKSMVDLARANIGVPVSTLITTTTALATISNTYRFTRSQVVVSQKLTTAEKHILNMGVTQAVPLTLPTGGSRRQFMAGIGVAGGLDFSTLADMAAMTADIDITPAQQINPNAPATRATQWVYDSSAVPQYGMSVGLLPVRDSHPTQRLKNAATKPWFISNSFKKNYPQICWVKTMNIGDTLSGSGYRQYLAPPTTSVEVVVSDGAATWVLLERLATTAAAQMQAPALLGRKLQPVGPVTVTYADTVNADGISYAVPAGPGQATFAVVEAAKASGASIPGSTSVVGNYFVAQQGSTSTQTLAGSYQVLYLFPVYLPEAVPVDRACFEVTTLGTGNLRTGVYENDPATGMPVLTGPIADFGLQTVTAVAIKEATLSPPVTLPAGWHWWGCVWQTSNVTAPTLRITSTPGLGPFNIGASSSTMGTGRLGHFASGVSGALGALTLAGTHQLFAPRMAYRRA